MHKFSILLFLLLTFNLFGCMPSNTPYIDFDKTQSTPPTNTYNDESSRPLRIAVATVISPHATIEYYRNVANHISKQLNRPTVLIQRKTYEEVNMIMSNGDADIAFMSTGAYSAYRGLTDIEIIAMVNHRQTSSYHAQIIVHKDSDIFTEADLQGKSFAFTDPLSFSGHIAIVDLLNKRNIRPEQYFSRYLYTYSHDKSIWAVANKVVDAASIDSMLFDYSQKIQPELAKNIRIISIIGPYPTGPVVVRSKLNKEQKDAIQHIFLTMHKHEDMRNSLDNLLIDNFILPNVELYKPLQKIYDQIGGI